MKNADVSSPEFSAFLEPKLSAYLFKLGKKPMMCLTGQCDVEMDTSEDGAGQITARTWCNDCLRRNVARARAEIVPCRCHQGRGPHEHKWCNECLDSRCQHNPDGMGQPASRRVIVDVPNPI